VRYLFYAIPGLIALAWMASSCTDSPFETLAGVGLTLGTLVFSGSLLLLAMTGNRRWGAVTPIGGALLLIGWIGLIATALVTSAPLAGGFTYLVSC
jgi:uncharacterized membrane protein YgdD (TMEM256/DUF423 family)